MSPGNSVKSFTRKKLYQSCHLGILVSVNTTQRRTKTRDLSPLTLALAARLRMQAAKNNLTQTDLARVTGIHKSQVSKIWRGLQMMDSDQIEALFTAAGADPVEEFQLARMEARRQAPPTPTPIPEGTDPLITKDGVRFLGDNPRPGRSEHHASRGTRSVEG